MSKTPTYDAKVKAILDALVPGERTCALTGQTWMMTQEEIGWYKRFRVAASPLHPMARQKILSGFSTGYQWWNQKHPVTGANLVTAFHPATRIRVLPDREWFDRDFSDCGLEPSVEHSVFETIRELMLRVPLPANSNAKETENSIALLSGGDRNSYFVSGCDSEFSLYALWSSRLSGSCLVWNSDHVTESFHVSNSKNVHGSLYVRDSKDVLDSALCFFCEHVESCFGATNQRYKKFIFFNEQLSESEYRSRMREVDLSRWSEQEQWLKRYHELIERHTIWPEQFSRHTQESSGEYNYSVRNCKDCYGCVRYCSDLYACQFSIDAHESAYSSAIFSSRCYEAGHVFHSMDIQRSFDVFRSRDLEYCLWMYDCEHCFGCVGLRHKRFYIFNKPYEEEAYWRTLDEIKCRMLERQEAGLPLPLWLSPVYFGESGAVNHFGAAMHEWEMLGGRPFPPESEGATGDLSRGVARSSKEIPESIDEVRDEDWVGKPILDEEHQRRFAFLKPELDFYRRKRLAPPRTHFAHRMIDLLHESNLAVFEDRTCAKCGNGIRVAKNITYPNRIIYCMPCYLKYMEQNG